MLALPDSMISVYVETVKPTNLRGVADYWDYYVQARSNIDLEDWAENVTGMSCQLPRKLGSTPQHREKKSPGFYDFLF